MRIHFCMPIVSTSVSLSYPLLYAYLDAYPRPYAYPRRYAYLDAYPRPYAYVDAYPRRYVYRMRITYIRSHVININCIAYAYRMRIHFRGPNSSYGVATVSKID